jgi:DnaK suppressor protein
MKKTKAAVATPGVAGKASKNASDSRSQRYQELRTILEDRRREIQSEVQSRMKDVRADAGQVGVVDEVETSESDIQDEIEFALIQMKAETLHRINEALERLEEGTYGRCFECGDEIGPQRLRALPFAVRCKDCEEAREVAAQRERVLSRRATGFGLDLSQ